MDVLQAYVRDVSSPRRVNEIADMERRRAAADAARRGAASGFYAPKIRRRTSC